MMGGYELPTSAVIGGREREIRSDYRAILDIMSVLSDAGTEPTEKTIVALAIFYVNFDTMRSRDYQEAYDYLTWFINGGVEDADQGKKQPKLMDWQQDLPLIIAPVNRVIGCEVRAVEYMHWWTFLAAYREIGDCLFAQVVSIRKKKQKGVKLDKADREFYRNNRELVDFKIELTQEEQDFLDEWLV